MDGSSRRILFIYLFVHLFFLLGIQLVVYYLPRFFLGVGGRVDTLYYRVLEYLGWGRGGGFPVLFLIMVFFLQIFPSFPGGSSAKKACVYVDR